MRLSARGASFLAPRAAPFPRLIDLAENGATEDIRRRAAESILDRAGVRGGVEVEVTTFQQGTSPAEVLRERLATLAKRTPALPAGDDGAES